MDSRTRLANFTLTNIRSIMMKFRGFTIGQALLVSALGLFSTALGAQQDPIQVQKAFHHVLLYQWSDTVTEAEKEQLIDLFNGLPRAVEGVLEVEVNTLLRASVDYDFRVHLRFSGLEALHRYENHREHNKIVALADRVITGHFYYRYWDEP